MLTTYFKKILSCCKIYCVEKKKCLEKFVKVFLLTKEQKHSKTSFSVREDLSKPKAYLGSLPPAIEFKGFVSMKLSEKNTTYHFTHISFMKGFTSLCNAIMKKKDLKIVITKRKVTRKLGGKTSQLSMVTSC